MLQKLSAIYFLISFEKCQQSYYDVLLFKVCSFLDIPVKRSSSAIHLERSKSIREFDNFFYQVHSFQ